MNEKNQLLIVLLVILLIILSVIWSFGRWDDDLRKFKEEEKIRFEKINK